MQQHLLNNPFFSCLLLSVGQGKINLALFVILHFKLQQLRPPCPPSIEFLTRKIIQLTIFIFVSDSASLFLWLLLSNSFHVLYSTLLYLPSLRFHCVGGCWDRTQDCRDQHGSFYSFYQPLTPGLGYRLCRFPPIFVDHEKIVVLVAPAQKKRALCNQWSIIFKGPWPEIITAKMRWKT